MIEFKSNVLANKIAKKCIAFAKGVHATRLSEWLIAKQVLDNTPDGISTVLVYSKVLHIITQHGIGIKQTRIALAGSR